MGIYYVLTQVTNISQRNSCKLFYRVLGETAQKWQLVYEDFWLVSAFSRARMAFTSSLARSVMSPLVLVSNHCGLGLVAQNWSRDRVIFVNKMK